MDKVLVQSSAGNKKTILFDILKEQYDLLEYGDAFDACRILEEKSGVSAIILDMQEEGSEYDALIQMLRHTQGMTHISAIADISDGGKKNELKALHHGITTVLREPYDSDIVLLQVKEAMNSASSRAQIQYQFKMIQQQFKTTLSMAGCGIAFLQFDSEGKLKSKYFNDGICRMMHATAEQIRATIDEDIFAPVHQDERDYVRTAFVKAVLKGQKFSETYRLSAVDDYWCWVHMEANFLKDEDGKHVYFCVYTDVTKEKEALEKAIKAEQKFKMAQEQLQTTIDNVECGIMVLQSLPDGTIGVIYVNDGICRMLNAKAGEIIKITEKDAFAIVHKEDREHVKEVFHQRMLKEKGFISETLRMGLGGQYIWMDMKGNVLVNEKEEFIYYCVFADITKEKEAQETVVLRDAVVSTAVEQTGIIFWTMDLQNRQIIYDDSMRDIHMAGDKIRRWEKYEWFHPDDLQRARTYFESILAGQRAEQIEVRLKCGHSEEYFWARITHTILTDEHGHPVKAVGSSIDISEQKRIEDAFDEQMSFLNMIEQKVTSYCRLNLSQNIYEQGQVPYRELKELFVCQSVNDFFSVLYPFIPDMEQRQEYQRLFCISNMLECFREGRNHLQLVHKTTVNPLKTDWVETHANIMKNPKSGDIEAMMYTFDIDEAKTTQLLVEQVIDTEYDYLSTIDMQHNIYRMYSHSSKATSIPKPRGSFDQIRDTHAATTISEGTRKAYLRQLEYGYIKKRLKTEEQYSFTFETVEADGSIRIRKMKLFYMDRDAEILCAACRDITDIVAEEQRKAELMKDTLEAVKQASTAKSDFLSRMSHEIRTPMNAIIGMSTIAAQSIGDDKQIADCLSKIGLSSRFLLTLINDILDMSRIESGKVLLKSERIPFREFISGINDICCSQAQAKEVVYENIVDAQLDDYYIGDAMKLQQILINILSNAVKFTPMGGKVIFRIRERTRVKGNAVLEFVISDTGCGMSDNFIPELFEPFTQEQADSTSVYGGTGLGMAICKSFVDLMDGHINVRSILGKGTEFIVDVKLGITHESKMYRDSKHNSNFSNLTEGVPDFDFTGKTILLVEDHPMNAEIATILLERKGVKVDYAENGAEAVEMFALSSNGYYNAILMDIHMPVMDGLQATVNIRDSDKADAKSIPIIAMTADAFEDDVIKSKQAGMNAHLAKPIEQEDLFGTLYNFICEK